MDLWLVVVVVLVCDVCVMCLMMVCGLMVIGKFFVVWFVNKFGGLIYYCVLCEDVLMLDVNVCLCLVSVWYLLYVILRKVALVTGCAGIESLECDMFDLYCF